jgi:hypothetical protein
MKQKKFLCDFKKIADIHAARLESALKKVSEMIPFTAEKFKDLNDQQIAYLDMVTLRFSKLQDVIGVKIFPLTLEILGEEAPAFIDKLNRLEKLGYIDSTRWWMELREIRNQITHDYPDNYEVLASHFNDFVKKAEELLAFWGNYSREINDLSDK